MNSVGVATGSGAGMALAHCIVDGHTPADLQEADPKRFPDGMCSVKVLSERVPEVLGKHYEITFPGHQRPTSRGLKELKFFIIQLLKLPESLSGRCAYLLSEKQAGS